MLSCLFCYEFSAIAMEQHKASDYWHSKIGVVPNLKFMVAYQVASQKSKNKFNQNIPQELKELVSLIRQIINLDEDSGFTENVRPTLFSYINNSNFHLSQESKEFNETIQFLITNNKADLLKLLLNNSVDLNKSDLIPLLCSAAFYFSIEVIPLLLSNGADPNIKDNHGNTALYLLIDAYNFYQNSSCINTINILLDNGANINLQNNYGNTPLIIACKIGEKDIVDLLIKRGADITIQDNGGIDALQTVVQEIIKIEQSLVILNSAKQPNYKEIKKISQSITDYKAIGELLLNKNAQSN